ncbi:MAG: hypothetical protein ABIE74_05480 [Pseudomonadota bacterium]
MKRSYHIITALVLLICGNSYAAETDAVSSLSDISRLVNERNFDIRILQEDVRRAQGALHQTQSQYYFPTLKGNTGYQDNRQEPISPSMPARIRDFTWDVGAEQKLPVGVTLNYGVTNSRTTYFQSDPPNALLPYPATLNEPAVYFGINIDLIKDLFGYTSRKELKISGIDALSAKIREELLRNQVNVSASSLFLQIHYLDVISDLKKEIVREFSKLEKDLELKRERSVAEEGDVYMMKKLVASNEADLTEVKRMKVSLIESLRSLLNLSSKVEIEPSLNTADVKNLTRSCEQKIITSEFKKDYSKEFMLAAEERRRGVLQSKIDKVQKLPQLALRGGITATGTENSFTKGFGEVGGFDRPIYEVGMNLSVPISPKKYQSANELSMSSRNKPQIEEDRLTQSREVYWNETVEKIKLFSTQQGQLKEALNSGVKQIYDLLKRYNQGRLSLFELTQERIELLKLRIIEANLMKSRYMNIYGTLERFDQFRCPLITDNQ